MFNLGSSAVVHAQIRQAHFTEGFFHDAFIAFTGL